MSLIANIVNELIWNLETSIQSDSAIMGSDMMLKGEKRKVNLYSAYQILKVEHNKLLTMLPSFGSLTEVIKFRKSKRADIQRLLTVLLELENILRTNGRNAAIKGRSRYSQS